MNKVFSLQLSGGDVDLTEGDYFSRQSLPWGTAIWLTEPGGKSMSRITVGLISFHPYCSQPEHSHRREEQVIYVISGKGEHMVDGVTYQLNTGSYVYVRPHSRHVMFNNNPEELRILVIYIYYPLSALDQKSDEPKPWYVAFISGLYPESAGEAHAQKALAPPPALAKPYDAGPHGPEPYFPGLPDAFFDIEALRLVLDSLSQALDISISLLDTGGRSVFQTENRAPVCSMLAKASSGAHCQRFLQDVYRQIKDTARPHFFFCCNNIASIIVPMAYGDRIVAYLKCGEIFLSTADRDKLFEQIPRLAQSYGLDAPTLHKAASSLPIEPKSRLYTVAEATMTVARAIMNQAESKRRQHELDTSRLSLMQEQLAKAKLEKALHESGLKLLQSQVNPHFLFNTLNTIAQMAYLEGAAKASGLTRDLSELLRYTLRNSEQIIPLHDELSLLRHYINIQKERFGERISFTVRVDEQSIADMSALALPCMILQPLVENAIVHGLENRVEGGSVEIVLRQANGMLMASVRDNGCGFEPEAIHTRTQNRVGLKSTRSRLNLHYGDNFIFYLHSAPGHGCEVTLGVPLAALPDEAPPH